MCNLSLYCLCDNRGFKITFAFSCRQFFMPMKPKISVFSECHQLADLLLLIKEVAIELWRNFYVNNFQLAGLQLSMMLYLPCMTTLYNSVYCVFLHVYLLFNRSWADVFQYSVLCMYLPDKYTNNRTFNLVISQFAHSTIQFH